MNDSTAQQLSCSIPPIFMGGNVGTERKLDRTLELTPSFQKHIISQELLGLHMGQLDAGQGFDCLSGFH